MKTTRTPIDKGWQVRPLVEQESNPALHLPPLPAEVPGYVHLDLQRAGVIPDPFYRLNERTVAWVDDTDWVYQTTFHLDAMPAGDLFLRFQGLDTIADITLNGASLGMTDNMFVEHEFNVRSLVQPGENDLTVTFYSARRVGRERLLAWSGQHEAPPDDYFLWDARSFVRKAQYMFGWDWGPILISCGIWRPVELIHVPVARIEDWRYAITFDDHRALVRIETTVAGARGVTEVPVNLTVNLEGAEPVRTAVPLEAEDVPVSIEIPVEDVRLWSPDNPELYALRFDLDTNGTTIETRQARIGLRTIELLREPDADAGGEGFVFRVNGEPLFCKGANWIPADSFPTRSYDNADRIRPLLRAAREAGCNMLRVWGGGMYESDTFYDLCDELGLLVWQDFPYACAYYPDDQQSLKVAADEAAAAVRRLRTHPSLALWCGNNENYSMFADDWHELNPPRFLGQPIYESVLPEIVAREDPATPYWPGSAYGGEDPNSAEYGDRHNWDVWHGEGVEGGDWPHYLEDHSRFCSEFGFASSCGFTAWDTCLAPTDRSPASPAVRWHDKTAKPYDVYLGYIQRHFPVVHSLEDLVYYSQLNQAEAMRCGVEHYRRSKGHCWGTLIWQLNDCWPVQSWAMIDYLEEYKAVYYAARRFYAPVLLSSVRQGEGMEFHLTNDLPIPVSGSLSVGLMCFDGATLREEETSVSMGANATGRIGRLQLSNISAAPQDIYLFARFRATDETIAAESVTFLREPKELRLAHPHLESKIDQTADGLTVTIETQAFAAYVWLAAPGLGPLSWSDNFFHVLPAEPRTVTVRSREPLRVEDLRESLTLRTLNDAILSRGQSPTSGT